MVRTIKGRPLEIESQVPIIQELERCAVWVYANFGGDRRELPALTVSIQTRGKKHTLCGFFRAEGFHTKEGEPVHEITVTSEQLFKDPYDVLETVVHETVHLYNHDLGEKDQSKGGRHNKVFRDQALDWGLEVQEPTDTKGYAYTSLSAPLRASLEKDFQPNLEVFRIFKEAVEPKEKKTPVKKQRPWVCQCEPPITVQVATGIILNAQCQECNEYFVVKPELM